MHAFFRMLGIIIVPTLLFLASRKVASMKKRVTDLDPDVLPLCVTEHIVCQMEPLPLIEFIDAEGGFFGVRKRFTTDGFQKLMLRFCILLERKNLAHSTKKKMIDLMQQFKNLYPYLCYNEYEDYFCKKESTHKHTNGDWALRSLGLFCNFEYASYCDESLEIQFFKCKFWKKKFGLQFPIPVLPLEWIQLLPKHVNPKLLPSHNNSIKKQNSVFVERNCLRRSFFFRLLAMTEAFVFYRPHETLAYGFELCSNNDFFDHESMHKYYLYVYGMISVTLAMLNCEHEWCIAFMEKSLKFIKNHSQILDVLHYQQMMYSYLNWWKQEEMAFEKIFKNVPINSQFHISSFDVQIKSFISHVEMNLCKILCFNNADVKTRQDYDYKMRLLAETEFTITKKKQFFHECLTVKQIYEIHFELGLILCDIYNLCIQKIKNGPQSIISVDKLNYIAFQLAKIRDFRTIFFRCVGKPNFYDSFYFEREMGKIKEDLEKETCLVENERWAGVCLSTFLLFQTIGNEPQRAIDWLDDGCKIYEKCNSDKANICHEFKHKTTYFLKRPFISKKKKGDISLLLKEVKSVGKYTKLGVLSIVEKNK